GVESRARDPREQAEPPRGPRAPPAAEHERSFSHARYIPAGSGLTPETARQLLPPPTGGSRLLALVAGGGLTWDLGPPRAPPGFRVGDLPDEPLDERGLGVQHREPVFLLDQEQLRHALGERAVDHGPDLGALFGEPGEPPPQQGENLVGWQRGDQRERGDEVRVF